MISNNGRIEPTALHHINGDAYDNRPENLRVVNLTDASRKLEPLRLFHARVGSWTEVCHGCIAHIPPHALIVARTDGNLFCSAECEKLHPGTTPTSTDPIS